MSETVGKRAEEIGKGIGKRAEDIGKGIGEFIREQRRLAGLSLRHLAELAKVSNAYLSQIERGIYKPSAKVLKHVAEALDISAENLYTAAGFLDTEDHEGETPDVEKAVRLDRRLSTEQKETLIRVYRGLVEQS